METSTSLLERVRDPNNEAAWRQLDDLYRPLIRRWVLLDPRLRDDVDDLVQEVMTVLLRQLPSFRHQRPGSFRTWLRKTIFHKVQAHYRARRIQPRGRGGPLEECPLAQLDDPKNELSAQWDQEHDRYVLRRLLERVEPMFEPKTIEAFHRVFFDKAPPAQVAQELGMRIRAVYLAKSRVLKKLRQEAKGLIDSSGVL